MRVAGVDVSTKAIDIVLLPLDLDTHEPLRWEHHELIGPNALDRVALAPSVIPRGTFWDSVAEVAIERPYGPGRDITFALHLAVGVVLASLPERLRPPQYLHPSQWRKQAGLHGNATKQDVYQHGIRLFPILDGAPQDAVDAALIAHASRIMNHHRLENAA